MYSYINTCVFLLALGILNVHGQFIYKNFKNATRDLKNDIVNKSLVQIGNAIANSMAPLNFFAETLAQVFGNGREIPTFAISRNLVDMVYADKDYKAGLSNEDANLNIEELITKYGYPVEKHQVETEDWYELTMFRIPKDGVPVFLMHGITGSADDFVVAGPESGLAYLLSNEGFDVWMGNARGNKFSREHVFLKPSEATFWDFSWHEIGVYDLPAMIDYVLEVTSQTKLKYLGHSQGTTTFFVMASERPQYNEKIEIMIALAPVAFMSNTKTPIARFLAAGTTPIYSLTQVTGINELLADTKINEALKAAFCDPRPIQTILCGLPLLLFIGFSVARVNVTNLPVLLGHAPSGASAKQFVHYGQIILSGKFRQFDYGSAVNFKRYGSLEPPNYELGNIAAPVVLIYSPEDWFVQPEDVDKLAFRLKNLLEKAMFRMFNHLDFLFAKDLKTTIYPKIVDWLKK